MAIPVALLSLIVPLLSPAIRTMLEGQIRELHKKALETDTMADDIFTATLASLLGIKL